METFKMKLRDTCLSCGQSLANPPRASVSEEDREMLDELQNRYCIHSTGAAKDIMWLIAKLREAWGM